MNALQAWRRRERNPMRPFYVTRDLMPQVDEDFYPALFEFCRRRGCKVTRKEVDPAQLRGHQQVDTARALGMPEAIAAKPVLISGPDRFVLDGNHRVYKRRHEGELCAAWEFDIGFDKAVELLFEFPLTYRFADGPQPERN